MESIHILFIFIYFKQYLVRGAQFSGAGLNGALTKKKQKTHTRQIKMKKLVQLSITKVREAHLGLDLKCLLGQTQIF